MSKPAKTAKELKSLLSRLQAGNPSEFDEVLEQIVAIIPDDASEDNPLAAGSATDNDFIATLSLIGWTTGAVWDAVAKTWTGPKPTNAEADGLDFAAYAGANYLKKIAIMDASVGDQKGVFDIASFDGTTLVLKQVSDFWKDDQDRTITVTTGNTNGSQTFKAFGATKFFSTTKATSKQMAYFPEAPRDLRAKHIYTQELGASLAPTSSTPNYYLDGVAALPNVAGYTAGVNDQVVVANQANKFNNGIWQVQSSANPFRLYRPYYLKAKGHLPKNSTVRITEGPKKGSLWRVESSVDFPDPGIDAVSFERADESIIEVSFENEPSLDIKAGGDGPYTLGAVQFDAANTAACTKFELVNGVGLQVIAANAQEFSPPDDKDTAPRVRVKLSTLLAGLSATIDSKIELWLHLAVANLSSAAEACGIALVSDDSPPTRYAGASLQASGVVFDLDSPSAPGRSSVVDAGNGHTVLLLSKAPGSLKFDVRIGTYVTNWPDIADTTLLGSAYLEASSTTITVPPNLLDLSKLYLVIYVGSALLLASPSYSHAQGSGARTGTISVSSSLTLNPADPIGTTLVNGDTASDGQTGFVSSPAVAGETLAFDFGAAVQMTESRLYSADSSSNGTWYWESSDDGISWTRESVDFAMAGSVAGNVLGDLSAVTNQRRHWRMKGVSGNGSGTAWMREIEFKLADVSVVVPADHDLEVTFKHLKAKVTG